MKVKVSNIEWDLSIDDDDDGVAPTDLPTTLFVNLDDGYVQDLLTDMVLNTLSNEYGWCVKDCTININEKEENND